MKKRKGIDGKLDQAWAILVKHRAGWKCEFCGKKGYLNAHHIYSRSKKSTRWDVANGISLCVGHHVFNSKFSAHKTPLEFVRWLENYKGIDYLERLTLKAHTTLKLHKFEKEVLLEDMLNKIKDYETKI